ncbi:hypothetical protein JW905_02135, partial [bacterium]|nr:hypothetical protein [candidate division CSSED10-310 bacterium]
MSGGVNHWGDAIEQVIQRRSPYYRKIQRDLAIFGEVISDRLGISSTLDGTETGLWISPVERDFELLRQAPAPREQIPDILGAYFGLRWLLGDIYSMDALAGECRRGVNETAYDSFLHRQHGRFEDLLRAYFEVVLDHYHGPELLEHLALMAVQSPMDKGIIHLVAVRDQTLPPDLVDQALFELEREAMRHAIPLSFKLANFLNMPGYAARQTDYLNHLRHNGIHTPIEHLLMGTRWLAGSRSIAAELTENLQTLYADGVQPSTERIMRHFLTVLACPREQGASSLDPEAEVLEPLRLVGNLSRLGPWLEHQDQEIHIAWRRMVSERTRLLRFFATFRELTRITILPMSLINLSRNGIRERLQQIAAVMGYFERPGIASLDYLLARYHDGARATGNLLGRINDLVLSHLRTHSVFVGLAAGESPDAMHDFRRHAAFFGDDLVWTDLVEDRNDAGSLFQRMGSILDSAGMAGKETAESVRTMLNRMVTGDLGDTLRLGISIARDDSDSAERLRQCIRNRIKRAECTELIRHFDLEPEIMWRYLAQAGAEAADEVLAVVGEDKKPETQALRSLGLLFRYGSPFFMRIIDRLSTIPAADIPRLGDLERLRQAAWSMLARVYHASSRSEWRQALGIFFDMEFARASLMLMRNRPMAEVNQIYTTFSDRFLKTAFSLSMTDVEMRRGLPRIDAGKLAVFVTGGHARKQALNDDYDLMTLVMKPCGDEELQGYTAVIGAFSQELNRRGMLAHHRFAEFSGRYIMTLEELLGMLRDGYQNDFIEKS